MAESGFTSMKVNEYNQFVRGELFVLVDSLATVTDTKGVQVKPEVDAVLQVSSVVIKLVCQWLRQFPENLRYYVECGQVQNLYLVSLKHAVAASLPELAEMLKLCFGLVARGDAKFASLSKELRAKQGVLNSFLASENLLQKANIAVFNEEKGSELVMEAVTRTGNECPVAVITELLDPLVGILSVQKDEAAKLCISEIFKKLVSRFSTLTDKDVKEITRSSIQKLFYILESIIPSKSFLSFSKDSLGHLKEDMLKTLFSIAIQLINTPYIQKRLLGISMIKEMIPRQSRHIPSSTEWKDPTQLVKTMEDKKLLDIILGENAHAEIIRKADDIFFLYLNNKKLEKKHIELLWKCANEKHEAEMRACLDLLTGLINRMSASLIQDLFKFIETGSYQNEVLVKFLENYTLTILKLLNLDYPGKKSDPSKPKLYDLDLFWRLILDPHTPGKLKDLAMAALVNIMEKYTFLLNEYVYKAAELIRDRKGTIRGMQLLKSMDFAGYYTEKQGRRCFVYKVEELNVKYSLIESILKDCEEYHSEVKAKVKAPADKSVMETDFGSGFTFHDQAALYIEFLLYLCIKSELTLSKEEFLKLWRCYIEEGLCEEHSDILFNAMMMETKYKQNHFVLVEDKVARAVFDELLCSPADNLSQLNSSGFLCFRKYMTWVYRKDTVSVQSLGLKGNKGFKMLWTILFQTKNEQLKEQAKELLVAFIDNMCQQSRTKRKEIIETALEFALDNVKNVEDVEQTKIALQIINAIIDRIELINYEQVGPEYSHPPLISFQISYSSKEPPLVVKINESMKLSNLKCLLSNKLKINKSKIILKNFAGTLQYSDERYYLLSTLKRSTDKLLLEVRHNSFPETEAPRFILANSSLFARLKSLLASPREEVVEEVWSLALNLPVNEAANERLDRLKLQDTTIKAWQEFLEVSAEYNSVDLVYYLYILNGKMGESGNKKYVEQFIKKGGTVFVFSVFTKKLNETYTMLNLKSLEYCIRIISTYILEEYGTLFEESGSDKIFWDGAMQLMQWTSDGKDSRSPAEGKNNVDSSGIFEACCKAHYLMLKANNLFIEKATNNAYVTALKNCLLLNKNRQVQTDTQKLLEKLLLEILSPAQAKQQALMKVLLTTFLTTALNNCANPVPYFDLITALIVFPFVCSRPIGELCCAGLRRVGEGGPRELLDQPNPRQVGEKNRLLLWRCDKYACA